MFFFGNVIQLSNKNECASFQEHWITSAKPQHRSNTLMAGLSFLVFGAFLSSLLLVRSTALAYLWTLAGYLKKDVKKGHRHILWTLFRFWFPVSTFFIIQRRFTCAIGAQGLRPLTYSRLFTHPNSHDKWFLSVTRPCISHSVVSNVLFFARVFGPDGWWNASGQE